ncbi:MAG: hypothetical protein ABR567_14910 [Myxococcales bacterium]|nr:hypothetical protein [Myxococcales bacterium]
MEKDASRSAHGRSRPDLLHFLPDFELGGFDLGAEKPHPLGHHALRFIEEIMHELAGGLLPELAA